MAAWKQMIVAVLVLCAAAVAWARYYPGAADILAGWNLAWAHAAVAPVEAERAPSGGGSGVGGERGGPGGRPPETAVITRAVVRETINDELSAIGTGRALNSVTVVPYASGRLTRVAVTSGAKVEAGDIIADLDSEAEVIALDRARITLADAEARLQRVNSLRASNTATTVQVNEAELAVGNAELIVREAELAVERRRIVAPISGVIGILPIEAGNFVTTATPIATIDDRSRIVIDFWAPERYARSIRLGADASATPIAGGGAMAGAVSAIDNRIDEQSRTLRVQATVENAGDELRAGMSFQVQMRFPGDSFAAVPPLAVQWGADGSFVWAVRDGMAERVPARIIQRNTETVLIDAELREDDVVVTEGIHAVRQGEAVLVAGAPVPNPAPAQPQASAVPVATGG